MNAAVGANDSDDAVVADASQLTDGLPAVLILVEHQGQRGVVLGDPPDPCPEAVAQLDSERAGEMTSGVYLTRSGVDDERLRRDLVEQGSVEGRGGQPA